VKRKPSDPRIFLAMGALAVVGGLSLLYFQFNGLMEEQAKVRRLTGEVQAQRDLPAQLEVSKRELDVTRAQLAHLERNVPEFAYVPTMLRELEALGKRSGLQVVGVRPLEKSDAAKAEEAKGVRKPYEEMEIEVTCRGEYASIVKFVQALNGFPKVVGARAISVEPKKDPTRPKEEKPPLEVNARLRAYLFRDGESATKEVPKTAMNEGVRSAG
jgi:type IV pilus assembly protein PilO